MVLIRYLTLYSRCIAMLLGCGGKGFRVVPHHIPFANQVGLALVDSKGCPASARPVKLGTSRIRKRQPKFAIHIFLLIIVLKLVIRFGCFKSSLLIFAHFIFNLFFICVEENIVFILKEISESGYIFKRELHLYLVCFNFSNRFKQKRTILY